MRLSLALIVAARDAEATRLNNLLKSVEGTFDEICVTITGENEKVKAVAQKYDAMISHFDWIDDFAAARNFNFKQCTGDWITWFDADDVVKGVENIRKNVELADSHKVTGMSTLYHYSHDSNGNVEDSHWKLQIVKAGYYEWKGMIHEDLLPVKDCRDAKIRDVIRVHTADKGDSEASLIRNIGILEKAIKLEPEEPRHYFYSARCYLGIGEWQRVIDVITTYLTLSDWPNERYDALNMMGEAYTRLDDTLEAIKTHHKAILELEDAPDAYIYKARNYIHREEWVNALNCLEIAEQRDKTATNLTRSALYDHDLYVLSAVTYMNLGQFESAVEAAGTAYKNRQSDHAKEILELAKEMYFDEQTTQHYRKLGETLLDKPAKLAKLLETVPESIKDDPRILQLQFSATPANQWSENSFVWFCGNSVEAWDGDSVKNGGIGGSETAVIELSRRMVAAGKEVTVYNRCDAPAGGKVIDGVTYRNYWEFDRRDRFNTLCLWRSPHLIDEGVTAKKLIVDMHDVSSDNVFTPERLEQIDTVMVKTEYHKALYPSVPEEKFVVIGNGISLERFKTEKKKKDRFIYTSSANRGLENILDVWPQIREQHPNAELHVFYGWNTFAEAHKHNPTKLEWMESMKKKMTQEGVVNHNRVDQNTLANEMSKSALWLYPTEFPEIHCITALEMQAAEVYPITTGFAALSETQQSGVKIEGDPKTDQWRERFLNEIDVAVNNPKILAKEIAAGRKYAESCSWDNVVNVWLKQM